MIDSVTKDLNLSVEDFLAKCTTKANVNELPSVSVSNNFSCVKFLWVLRKLLNFRCGEEPNLDLIRYFPSLQWTYSKVCSHMTPFGTETARLDPWCFYLLHKYLSPVSIVTVLKSLLLCESVLVRVVCNHI